MEIKDMPEYQEWIKTRPNCVQKMAAKYPPGPYICDGSAFFVVGYAENEDGSVGLHINHKEFTDSYDSTICPCCVGRIEPIPTYDLS